MMRSPHFIAVAIRKSNQRIVIRNTPYVSIAQKFPFLKKPILRGVIMLVESMAQGVKALSFSANVAAVETTEGAQTEELSSWAIVGSIATAFVLGMGLFVALPHFLTALLTGRGTNPTTVNSPIFHLVDGFIKIGILLAYVYLIAMMKDIHRVFQYHGAEHKSIYAFEAGEELTVENARKHSSLHPRCGTSFLFFLVLISVFVFSAVFPFLGLAQFSKIAFVNHLLMVVVKIVLMFPVAGLSYEFIKACASRMGHPFFRALVWPGMVLQHLTTREPTDEQLEVALASLRQVLNLEKSPSGEGVKVEESEIEIAQLSELGRVNANVDEFAEA